MGPLNLFLKTLLSMGGEAKLILRPSKKRAEIGLFLPSGVNQRRGRGRGRGQKIRKNRKGGSLLCFATLTRLVRFKT